MRRLVTRVGAGLALALIALLPLTPVQGQQFTLPPECERLAYSTEEDFVTQGPLPLDGNPIISDGDLLSTTGLNLPGDECVVCARNADLLSAFLLRV